MRHANPIDAVKLLETAKAHLKQGRTAEALAACEELGDVFVTRQDWAAASELGCTHGEALRKGRRIKEALRCFLEARRHAQRGRTPMAGLRAKFGLYSTVRNVGSQKMAYEAQEELLRACREEGHPDALVHPLLLLARTMRRLDLVEAEDSLLAELQAMPGSLTQGSTGQLLAELGWLRLRQGRLGVAESAFTHSGRIAAQLKLPLTQLECLRGLASIGLRRGDAWAVHQLLLEAEKCLQAMQEDQQQSLGRKMADPERELHQSLRRQLQALRRHGRPDPRAAKSGLPALQGRWGAA